MDFIMKGLPNLVKIKVGQYASTKDLWDILQDLYARKGTKENQASDNTDDEEVNRGEYFLFNCEEARHIEMEFPYLKIGSDETENPNEIEHNPEIEKEKNHEEKFNRQERKLEEEIISLKIQIEEVKRMEEVVKNQMMKKGEEVENLEDEVVM
jgi:hypothetical protein